MKPKTMLTNNDLLHKKYSIKELEENVDYLSKKYLLYTQHLTEEFCADYILDTRMNSGDEDSYLFCENYILRHQPHLDEKKFLKLCREKYKEEEEA